MPCGVGPWTDETDPVPGKQVRGGAEVIIGRPVSVVRQWTTRPVFPVIRRSRRLVVPCRQGFPNLLSQRSWAEVGFWSPSAPPPGDLRVIDSVPPNPGFVPTLGMAHSKIRVSFLRYTMSGLPGPNLHFGSGILRGTLLLFVLRFVRSSVACGLRGFRRGRGTSDARVQLGNKGAQRHDQ